MTLREPKVEVWTHYPFFRYVQGSRVGDFSYPLPRPAPYHFAHPTLCQAVLQGVLVPARVAPIRVSKVDSS